MKRDLIKHLRLKQFNKHLWVLVVSTVLVIVFAFFTIEYFKVFPSNGIPVTVDTEKFVDLLAGRISQFSEPKYLIRRRQDQERQLIFADFFTHNGKLLGTLQFSFQDLEKLNEKS